MSVAMYVVVHDAKRAPVAGHSRAMRTTIAVTVELDAGSEQIAGEVCAEDGWPRRFTGYVGLMAAIEAVLARERAGART